MHFDQCTSVTELLKLPDSQVLTFRHISGKKISEKFPPFCYFRIYQKSYDMRYSH